MRDQSKKWLLKEEDKMDLVEAVNQQGSEDWTKVGWGVEALMVEHNLKKAGKKVPDQESNSMDEEGGA